MSPPRLYFDATNVVSWGPQPPVGIIRVETTIVREALAAGHAALVIDEATRTPRVLAGRELEALAVLCRGEDTISASELGRLPVLGRLREALRATRRNRGGGGRELDRFLAGVITGSAQRSGLAYHAAKALVRTWRASVQPGTHPGPRSAPADEVLNDPASRMLWSNRAPQDLGFNAELGAARSFAILHDILPLTQPEHFQPRHVARFRREADWMTACCHRVICPSQYTREQASGRFPASANKFAVAQPAALLLERSTRIAAIRPALSGDVRTRFAIYCATIEPRKNHLTLIVAWRRLQAMLGEACPSLIVVGRWGWMFGEIERELARARLDGVPIHHLAAIDDSELIWLYRHALLGVYPSAAEGFGLGVAECLDFGTPVVISDAPALLEAAQGLMPVVAAMDADAWAVAVRSVVVEAGVLDDLRATVARRYRRQHARAFFEGIVKAMTA